MRSDRVVPSKYQRRVADAYAGPKREIVMKHAGHDDLLTAEASKQMGDALEWMWNASKRGVEK